MCHVQCSAIHQTLGFQCSGAAWLRVRGHAAPVSLHLSAAGCFESYLGIIRRLFAELGYEDLATPAGMGLALLLQERVNTNPRAQEAADGGSCTRAGKRVLPSFLSMLNTQGAEAENRNLLLSEGTNKMLSQNRVGVGLPGPFLLI